MYEPCTRTHTHARVLVMIPHCGMRARARYVFTRLLLHALLGLKSLRVAEATLLLEVQLPRLLSHTREDGTPVRTRLLAELGRNC